MLRVFRVTDIMQTKVKFTIFKDLEPKYIIMYLQQALLGGFDTNGVRFSARR